MKNYPLDKYKFYFHTTYDGTNEVIAASTYAGKIVKAKAKCAPDDQYNEEKGMKLAAARCNARVAAKRKARAAKLVKEAEANYEAAKAYYEKMIHYNADACSEYNKAIKTATEIAAEL